MSYCRFGTDRGKSDVYIYGTYYKELGIPAWIICIAWKKKVQVLGNQHTDLICASRTELLEKMYWVRKQGLHVPRSAFKRVKQEMNKRTKNETLSM